MLEDAILLKQVWSELKEKGAEETEAIERITTGYTDIPYRKIKYQGLEFEIRQDDDYQYPFDDLEGNDEEFIVNYHRDFEVKKDEIITEEETAELYRGERNWQKTEREKGYWIFKLSCLIHSGVWLHFNGEGFAEDSGGWDTSRVGLVLVSKKIAKTQKKAEEIGEELVDAWNKALSGDVYNITIKKNGKEIDRIGGIIGEAEAYQFIKEYKV